MNASNRFGIETIARQHQAEISRELATRQLIRKARENMSTGGRSISVVLRMSPVFILTFLLLYFLH
jgi:hypothetical protein